MKKPFEGKEVWTVNLISKLLGKVVTFGYIDTDKPVTGIFFSDDNYTARVVILKGEGRRARRGQTTEIDSPSQIISVTDLNPAQYGR